VKHAIGKITDGFAFIFELNNIWKPNMKFEKFFVFQANSGNLSILISNTNCVYVIIGTDVYDFGYIKNKTSITINDNKLFVGSDINKHFTQIINDNIHLANFIEYNIHDIFLTDYKLFHRASSTKPTFDTSHFELILAKQHHNVH